MLYGALWNSQSGPLDHWSLNQAPEKIGSKIVEH